jgi:hypothetical protein
MPWATIISSSVSLVQNKRGFNGVETAAQQVQQELSLREQQRAKIQSDFITFFHPDRVV